MNVYRFRNINNLLGKYQELEEQYIYFASPEQLNDPMEGFRDIVWQGDKIVWDNFFKHYVYCLLRNYIDIRILGNDITRSELEARIPVTERWDRFSQTGSSDKIEHLYDIFNDICNRVYQKYELPKAIDEITRNKSRRDEVLFYLYILHIGVLIEIQEAFVERGLATENEQFPVRNFQGFKRFYENEYFELMRVIKEEQLEALFEAINGLLSEMIFFHKFSFSANQRLVICDFPKAYLKQLIDQLLYPKWYAACFMKDYQNSSVWGHYGKGHEGVCLIFDTEVMNDKNYLTLKETEAKSSNRQVLRSTTMPFYDIDSLVSQELIE